MDLTRKEFEQIVDRYYRAKEDKAMNGGYREDLPAIEEELQVSDFEYSKALDHLFGCVIPEDVLKIVRDSTPVAFSAYLEQNYMKFIKKYLQCQDQGTVDTFGGSESRSIFLQWLSNGQPKRIGRFIRNPGGKYR